MDRQKEERGHGGGHGNDNPGGGDHGGGHGHDHTVTIIVNGRPKEWKKDKISFEELVAIAGVPLPPGENPGFTITYRNGHGNKPEGTLTEGQSVKVKKDMVFNVTPTNRS